MDPDPDSDSNPDADPDHAIFMIDLQDANKKLIKKSFSAYFFLKVRYILTSFFKDKKSKRSHQAKEIKVVLTIFAW
jgi:ribosomal protein L23